MRQRVSTTVHRTSGESDQGIKDCAGCTQGLSGVCPEAHTFVSCVVGAAIVGRAFTEVFCLPRVFDQSRVLVLRGGSVRYFAI